MADRAEKHPSLTKTEELLLLLAVSVGKTGLMGLPDLNLQSLTVKNGTVCLHITYAGASP